MNKKIIVIISLLIAKLWAGEIPIDEVEKRTFSESIELNSQVVQLPSATSSVMARLGGKVIKYSVKEGDRVKRGQYVATIESLELASLSSELRGLKRELIVAEKNQEITQNLYDIGVESLHNLNRQEEELNGITSRIENIKSRLSLVDNQKGNSYRLYTQSSGRVDKILAPVHSVVDANEPLISIVKGKESFLIKSFIPLKYATDIRVGQKGSIEYGGRSYTMHITQILPTIDQQTQKMTVLSVLDKPVHNLFVNTFLDSKLFLKEGKSYLTVKKSALSFFNNEWVVFVPLHHEEDEHKEHHEKRTNLSNHAHEEEEHKEEKKEHHGHGDEDEEEIPYGIRVVKIIKQNSEYVAIEGLDEHEDYVSGKSYYVKSMLLKSSLGGHGH